MKIFKTYTGNAMLNNALMTIEALGKIDNITQITPELLLTLYEKHNIKSLNKRLKSYTMIFSLNNPLVNPAKKEDLAGEKIYENLIISILNNFESEGSSICEVSGLKFERTFESIYQREIEKLKQEVKKKKLELKDEKRLLKNLDNTDLSLNRSWFPLIGGLGSDAQALPQAKFTIQIHPICIAIMQFLPLSALLYKGGILLIDSSNFEFARSFIESNVKEVEKRIQVTSSNDSIENIKDFSKGNYLLKAIDILEDKEMEDEYSDLNLWRFSNSGTGASCEIERVPNSLIKKLMLMKKNLQINNELKSILNKNDLAYSFLQDLEGNSEWYLLYPNVFGTGKKKVEYEGVSVAFLEAYFKEIGSQQNTEYAKYLAYLIDKYKMDAFAKYLNKRDAYKEKNFKTDLYAVLVKAAENGEWDLLHHIEILDDPKYVPIKNNFYNIHRVAHFYFYKKTFSSLLPKLRQRKTVVQNVCEWLIAYIQNDDRQDSLEKDLLSSQNYFSANYSNVFYRASQQEVLDLGSIFYALYDENLRSAKIGLNSLLRIFLSQSQKELFEIRMLEKPKDWSIDTYNRQWLEQLKDFAQDYQAYYFDKYENEETGFKPSKKFSNLIKNISTENSKFLIWFYEAIENTNAFLKGDNKAIPDKWSEALLYPPGGEYTLSFAKFASKFLLLKQAHYAVHRDNKITTN